MHYLISYLVLLRESSEKKSHLHVFRVLDTGGELYVLEETVKVICIGMH